MVSGSFVLPDGSLFDHTVGLGENLQTEEFRGYGTFLDGTKDRLKRYGLSPTKVEAFSTIGAECGDDEIGVDTTPVYAAAKCTVYSEFLGVVVSEEDTSINPRFGNYCEDLVIVPDGYEQTYHFAQQTSNFRDMSYLDVPKFRLAIDIRPGRMSHSATNDGKAGILGSRLAWLPRDSPVRCLWEVFNLFQDVNLRLTQDSKFAYLPTALGGYGKPVPFGLASNFEAFNRAYKHGKHVNLPREFVRRANKRFREYTADNLKHEDPVLSAVARLQSSWHDWIKGKTLYAPTCWLDAPPEVHSLRVREQGKDIRIDAVCRRLQASGHLVSESDLAIAYEHNKLCQYLLGCETHEEFLSKKEEARKAWLNLSTFSLRLYGMIRPMLIGNEGNTPLTSEEYGEFWLNITKRRLHLRSFLRQENMYLAKAKDLVYTNGPMKTKVPLYPKVTSMGRRYWFEPVADLPSGKDENKYLDALLEWVCDDPDNKPIVSRELVEDDPWIIKEMSSSKNPYDGFAIVTDDVNLCREAYSQTRQWVVRVPVKWYYMSVYYGDGDQPWEAILKLRFPNYNWVTIEDTGSIASYEETNFRDGLPMKWCSTRHFDLTRRSITANLRRIRASADQPDPEEDPDWKPYRFPDAFLFGPQSFLHRKKHPHRRGWA